MSGHKVLHQSATSGKGKKEKGRSKKEEVGMKRKEKEEEDRWKMNDERIIIRGRVRR